MSFFSFGKHFTKESDFLLGPKIKRLVKIEGGVVAVWCWLPLCRGDHEEAIIPSMSGPVGTVQSPTLLFDNPAGVCRELINHCKWGKVVQHVIPALDSS